MYDVVIIGGSVAGLSAALLLGRCQRNTLVCDAGLPRNRFSEHMHGFLSREGISPDEFLRISREQVAAFPTIAFHDATICAIRREAEYFIVTAQSGQEYRSRTILLATGIVDELPAIPGIERFYGKSIHHCPYCDGWEHRNTPVAVYGRGEEGATLATEMLTWSRDITLCTDGAGIASSLRGHLESLGVAIRLDKIESLAGTGGMLEQITFANDTALLCKAMFFVSQQRQQNDLAQKLGCQLSKEGFLDCPDDVKTCIPGVYAAGNTSSGLQMAIVAAAEGAKAAHAIQNALMERENR